MKKTRLERILEAALDLAMDYALDQIESARRQRAPLHKPPKKGEVIIDADFEDVPAKALPTHRKGPSSRRRRKK